MTQSYIGAMTELTTRLKIASWDEKPAQDFGDGGGTTRAVVELAEGADGLESGGFEAVMYYRPDKTSSYVSVMRLVGTLEGRSGSFVAVGEGSFDGTTAASSASIVAGSGAGGLAGISGTVTSSSTHSDYPYMPLTLTYELG